jgi:two-component system KDP operon response regulator KdpE
MKSEPLQSTVLVIDDEVQIRRLLAMTLEAKGYRVLQAVNGRTGIAAVVEHKPDLIILDLGLPDMDGIEALKLLREWCAVPIIILSVRDGDDDKITSLDSGADDFLTKPFSSGELLARLRAAQRHAQPAKLNASPAVFQTGALEVDLAMRTVKVNGKAVRLSPTEFSLLRLFVRHAGKVLTHPQIMEEVWGEKCLERVNYLHVYVTHLREKIEANPAKPEILLNEPRVGYRLAKLAPAA